MILLDTDMLVRRNIDNLFDRACPAAVRRHAGGNAKDGHLMDSRHFMDKHGRPKGGINAGVMVLRTSRREFNQMMQELQREHGQHMKSSAPEQDFLSRWYLYWNNLSIAYNYQVHQLALTAREDLDDNCFRLDLDYMQVHVVHFSALPKPSSWFFHADWRQHDRTRFLREILCDGYYMDMLGNDRRPGSQGKKDRMQCLVKGCRVSPRHH